ncbi:MAG: hypothetical protein PVS2B3_01310 [Steroidobacteraceae bacterium]
MDPTGLTHTIYDQLPADAHSLCLPLVAGCTRQLPLALSPDAPTEVTEVGGTHYTLEPSSDGYRTLARWIAGNGSGWSWGHYYTTPPPRGIIVRSGSLELRFFDSTALVRTPQGDYLKDVPPSQYAFLRPSTGGG